jgi:hypothetical protein
VRLAGASLTLLSRQDRDSLERRMAYLPDLSSPSSWELGPPSRRSRGLSIAIALFFALLLCAATAFATAVYMDGVRVESRLALDSTGDAAAGSSGSGAAGDGGAAAAAADKDALEAAWVNGRKAGYKRGVAAGKAQAEKARKKAVDRAFAQGKAAGLQEGQRAGYSEGYQDASAKYDAAWKAANPAPKPGQTGAEGAATTPAP